MGEPKEHPVWPRRSTARYVQHPSPSVVPETFDTNRLPFQPLGIEPQPDKTGDVDRQEGACADKQEQKDL
jgi:hypothetical protein